MTDRKDFDDCRDCRCMAARREAARLTRSYDDHLRPHGLTVNQFTLLATLILAGPLPIRDLADRLGIDRTTLTRNVALSRTAGHVTEASGRDARQRFVSVTERGRALAEAALPDWKLAQAGALREAGA
ncbi:MarR family transcriptional regulator [Aquibium sp. ELW1220]|uniref:MarR family winged helix-turn-helix transcriptional regulator n=1 Tax=Aquibium sp. ELW1220 TaxID=2976766 RepID=UPI0025B117F7|nr:MarR family transcriptional regulator [Aquibium sp. ELW1220]MDN2582712.1 MarR family transcriptional regulator [Aquibium sp. ELW1220]